MIYDNGSVKIGMWKNGILTKADMVTPQCNICSRHRDPTEFHVACGQCINVICNDCYKNHYKEIKKGDVFSKSNICCPFCRKMSLYLDNTYDAIEDDTDFNYYGKCGDCLNCEVIDTTCNVDNNVPTYPEGFTCSKCAIPKKIKQCPKCHCHIEKRGGCNHMICGKRGCGHQFCWICFIDWDEDDDDMPINFHNDGLCKRKPVNNNNNGDDDE
jgi:hypothetical protein